METQAVVYLVFNKNEDRDLFVSLHYGFEPCGKNTAKKYVPNDFRVYVLDLVQYKVLSIDIVNMPVLKEGK